MRSRNRSFGAGAGVIVTMLASAAVVPAAYYLLGLAEPEDRQLLITLVRGAD